MVQVVLGYDESFPDLNGRCCGASAQALRLTAEKLGDLWIKGLVAKHPTLISLTPLRLQLAGHGCTPFNSHDETLRSDDTL